MFCKWVTMAPCKEGGSQPHTFTSRSPHRGKKTGRGVKGAQRTWTLTVTHFSSQQAVAQQLGPPTLQGGCGGEQDGRPRAFMECRDSQHRPPGPGRSRARCRCRGHTRPSEAPAPLWAGPQQQAPRVEAVALRVHLLQMPLPCTTAPLSASGQSAHRLSPHCFRMPRHQLLPQSLAPHSLQLARPGFLRSQGSEAGGAWATWGQPQAPPCLP